MQDNSTDSLDTLKEICAYLGKSEKTVRRLAADSGLPAYKIGGNWWSSKDLIDGWRLECLRQNPCKAAVRRRL
ncbi:helix-turn-helix domain-containing protein [Desulfovibrio sp. OttesenSCG-928-C06]|nr:helix-turn-helix domain-containing protein [Desulfovibrio sp. OttesenSCG-928-C06]